MRLQDGPRYAVDEQLRDRLSRQFDFYIHEAHRGEGVPFYWDPSLGLGLPDQSFYMKYIGRSDKAYYEYLRKQMDYEFFCTRTSAFLSAITAARSTATISLYTPLIVAATMTHGFRYVPKELTGSSSNNYYMLHGVTKCYTPAGVTYLRTYPDAKSCVIDLANEADTTEEESDTFLKLYIHRRFSLQLYRIYFLLTLSALKGVNVAGDSEESVHLDSSGRRYHPSFRYSRSYQVSENLFGYDYTTGKRPRGCKQEDGSSEERV